MKEIDTAYLLDLARQARATGTCRSVPLALMVKTIVKKVMCYKGENGKDFLGYSEDIKIEMFGNAVYAVYSSILEKADLSDGDRLFNYLYTSALNAIRKTINRYYSRIRCEVRSDVEILDKSSTNDVARHKTPRACGQDGMKFRARGLFPMYEKKVFEVAMKRKAVRLQNVIKMAVAEFVGTINKRDIKKLIKMARKIREDAC